MNLVVLSHQATAAFFGNGIEFFSSRSKLVGSAGDLSDGALQAVLHITERRKHQACFIPVSADDRLGQIATGNALRTDKGRGNGRTDHTTDKQCQKEGGHEGNADPHIQIEIGR